MTPPRINCYQCRHFYITWDKSFPNGCKSYGFKSKSLPSLFVYESSAAPCAFFQPKPGRNAPEP
ncbi:hypothetical protein EDC14_1006130 [Hydrogenispora ethanolica]|uniref:Uracil-DNA glycosylase n=1 Tax=Hydrogenispora ethanolica TaxID=1082276 RepID=A0A4V2QFM0_HYDET|nr:uracil-DNA glycosylase [Hydrogenispora ethanolica]TCL72417.1 hypothetical protein EDC14_1006130 [Hydrogenispora ethanolica]